MAKIGLNNFRYGILTEAVDGTPSYSGAKKPAKAISCNVAITNNSAMLYADDGLAETDTSFQSGTATVGIDDEDLETMADLLGHTYSAGVITRNANDVAPYVGFGRVIMKMIENVRKYKVEFLYKVKFSEPSQDNTTKGESLEFGTSEIEGTIAALANGNWSEAKEFDTQADAINYLESLLGTNTTYTLTYNANGGSGSVDSVTNIAPNSEVELDDGSGLTAPSNKTFGGWSKSPTATVATVSSPYIVTDDTTLYAVWVSAE